MPSSNGKFILHWAVEISRKQELSIHAGSWPIGSKLRIFKVLTNLSVGLELTKRVCFLNFIGCLQRASCGHSRVTANRRALLERFALLRAFPRSRMW